MTTAPVGVTTAWVKDGTNTLDAFPPHEDGSYRFEGHGTAEG
jgi:hypothetical protein